MAVFGFGLRAKSLLALLLATLLALLPSGLIGWQVLDTVRTHFGEAYARNVTLLSAQNILAPVARDLALSQRLADSVLTRKWLLDKENPELTALLFAEAEGYRQDFRDGNYFLISNRNFHYYMNDGESDYSEQARYVLNPNAPENAWYFNTMANTDTFNINVNPDLHLGVTRVWLNVVIYNGEEKIGLAGTGFDLSGFLEQFISNAEAGLTPMIINADGAIQVHPQRELIAFGTGAGANDGEGNGPTTLTSLLPEAAHQQALQQALHRLMDQHNSVETLWVNLDDREQLLALSYIPELNWFVVNAVDMQAARVMEGHWLTTAVASLVMMLTILLLALAYAVEKLLLKPLRALQTSAMALSHGNYTVSLPAAGRDELGDLSRAFDSMATQIKTHTDELEDKVRERTSQLEQTNREMAAAQKKINDSIDYASLIQRALLPDSKLLHQLGLHHFVLWHPRDVVGGDFYLFRHEGDQYLIGIVDCAGHGVPGALMTMLARAAFDDAMTRNGLESPARLLTHADTHLREMLRQSELPRALATNMDAGLVFIDRGTGILRYAGAKISLHWSDGEKVGEAPGGRRALCDRHVGSYEDYETPLSSTLTYYLTTDGYLDQAGGELGFGLGDTQFAELLRTHSRLPLADQAKALIQALEDYRGEHPQRDDITVLSFRID